MGLISDIALIAACFYVVRHRHTNRFTDWLGYRIEFSIGRTSARMGGER